MARCRNRASQVPAGLRTLCSGTSSPGRLERWAIGCRARPSSAGGSAPRASPSAAPSGICSWRDWSSGAPDRGRMCTRRSRPGAGAVVRAADSRPRRDRDLRADLPGDDGFAAGARARARVGQPARRGATKEERAWQLCQQYIERRVSGVFFAPLELGRRKRRRQPAHRRSARRRAHSGRAARPHGAALPGARPPRSRRHRQPPRRLRDHRAPAAAGQPPHRVSSALPNAAATVDAREAGYREALYAWNRPPIDRALQRVSIPPIAPAVRALIESDHPDAHRLRQRPHRGTADADAAASSATPFPATSAWSASTTWSTPACCPCR